MNFTKQYKIILHHQINTNTHTSTWNMRMEYGTRATYTTLHQPQADSVFESAI